VADSNYVYEERLRLVVSNENIGAVPPPEPPLKHGGGGGTYGGMEAVDAKIAAAEARTDVKFVELSRTLDKLATKEDITTSQNATRANIWAAIGVALGIILAVMAFAANRFDAGVAAGGALAPYASTQQQRDQAQDKKLDEILKRLPAK
jgi:hypothetical protein